ncbi:MAG: glycosyltransferase [Prochlorococcaceae cyanobacterium]
MDRKTLKSSRTAAALIGNKIYVAKPKQADSAAIAIAQGAQICHLKSVDASEFPKASLPRPQKIDLLGDHGKRVLEAKSRTVVDSGINKLPSWSLDGGKTFHLKLRPQSEDESSVIGLFRKISIQADNDGDWQFAAWIACHRAEAELEASWAHGEEHHTKKVSFETGKKGGRSITGYQAIKMLIPIKKGLTSFSLQVKYQAYIDDLKGDPNSYLFIANPFLDLVYAEAQQPPSALPRLSADQPSVATDYEYFSALFRPFSSPDDDPISLQWQDGRSEDLFSPLQAKVTLSKDYGHTLLAKASEAGFYSLYINGELSELLELFAGVNVVQVPRKWLRGESVLVQIRDAAGSQIFLSHPTLVPRRTTRAETLLSFTKQPFPTDLTCRANQRYQALRAHLKRPIPGISQDDLVQALETLDGNHATAMLKPLKFPEVRAPEVSVVIPAHNLLEVTYYALCSLLLAHNTTRFEVILVDDGSTDQTTGIEDLVQGIRVIHNKEPQRFIKACNRGVSEARGHYVVLLNNDTEVTVGWLDALVDAFERFPGAGAVGAKLLYPDGTLQDAGGIIWRSGNPWNYGNKQNPWDPRFCYARQVDYLSGAALMTTREIWDEVDGLSSYLEPMYFEDTDFSFKVREAGYKTYFVPSSVVYHFEGTTSGTDASSGFKKYQEVNRPKFKRRWAKAFAHHGKEGVEPDLEKDRGITGRVLFIDYATPREDQDAGSYAAIREIELVQALGYKVTFLPQNLAFFSNYTEELQRMGVEVITSPFYLALADFLRERAKEFDAAYITRYYVAADTVHLIREESPTTRIILNNADLHFLRALRASLSSNDEMQMEVMRDIRKQELAMMRSVDLVVSYNDVEHAVISSHTDGEVKVMTCPWVVQIPDAVAPLAGRQGLSFLGSFVHPPNVEGVQWLCREVMPQLGLQQLRLSIYGSRMDETIKNLATEWINPVGYIEDVANAYQQHRVFVAPLLSGAGIKGKVLSALAYGIPTVLTPTAAEGIGLRHGHDCLIAKTSEEWVEAITRLCQDDGLWNAISKAGRNYVASQFSFEAGRQKMKAAFEAVDLFSQIDE